MHHPKSKAHFPNEILTEYDPERSERSGIKIRGPQEPADKAKDPDIKQFSSKFAPMIKSHLEMAQTTGEQLKVASKQAR
jgi:hypothetical protein